MVLIPNAGICGFQANSGPYNHHGQQARYDCKFLNECHISSFLSGLEPVCYQATLRWFRLVLSPALLHRCSQPFTPMDGSSTQTDDLMLALRSPETIRSLATPGKVMVSVASPCCTPCQRLCPTARLLLIIGISLCTPGRLQRCVLPVDYPLAVGLLHIDYPLQRRQFQLFRIQRRFRLIEQLLDFRMALAVPLDRVFHQFQLFAQTVDSEGGNYMTGTVAFPVIPRRREQARVTQNAVHNLDVGILKWGQLRVGHRRHSTRGGQFH